MEAKDTVMSAKQASDAVDNLDGETTLDVAEISFKAGYEAGWKGERNFILKRDSDYKAGRKEVVEWLEANALRATYIADPSKECWGISDYELAKLKEWGI